MSATRRSCRMLRRSLPLAVALLLCAQSAWANIIFQLDFGTDPTYAGTDGADRRAAVQAAADAFSAMFATHFTNSGTVILDVTGSNDPYSNVLASAGSYLFNTGSKGFGIDGAVMSLVQTGTNPFGSGSVGQMDVNFGQSWQLDINAPVSTSQYDFASTIFHELTHALGFAASINQNGTPYFGTTANGQWGPFVRFITDKNGTPIVTLVNGKYQLNQALWDAIKAGGGTVFFNGANAMAAYGGKLVPLYSPNPWEDGSSISHVDDTLLAGMLMNAATGTGLSARDYSAVEIGMLMDLGYTPVSATPLPAAVWLLGSGLAGLGGLRLRRRSA